MATFQTLNKKKYTIPYYIKKFVQRLKRGHLPPFDRKSLKIGELRAKDLRKNVTIFQEGGSTHALPTRLVIRVALLYKIAFC